MKVGTDAILIGVWCDTNDASFILDVGTGSGIIALLIASRSKANIHAIELDEASVKEAKVNFNNFSGNKLTVIHDDFINFAGNTKQKYDLIVSNPPFFVNSLLPDKKSRIAARHTQSLSHNQLCKGVTSLLSNNGKFCIVLPYDVAISFISIANEFNLHLHKQLIIYPKPKTNPNRINMEFRLKKPSSVIVDEITIRNIDGIHSFKYKNYVNDYLIKI
jgi:tRNA1Val (adenine37-N6)-methyltransferase